MQIFTENINKVHHQAVHPPSRPLNRRVLDAITLAYDKPATTPQMLLTASNATQNSPLLPSSGRNYLQHSLHLSTEGWPGWVGLDK